MTVALRQMQLVNLFLIGSMTFLILNSRSDLSKQQGLTATKCKSNHAAGNTIIFTALLSAAAQIEQ